MYFMASMLFSKKPYRLKCIKEVPTNFAKKRPKSKLPPLCGVKVVIEGMCSLMSLKRMTVKIACNPNNKAQFLIMFILLFLAKNNFSELGI